MRTPRALNSKPKLILFLAAPDSQILDVAGPYQVFVRAAELYEKEHPGKPRPYCVVLVSTSRARTVRTNCGLPLIGQATFRSIKGPIHTLLVAGGSGVHAAAHDEELLKWLKSNAATAQRFGSICTGAFLLAAAGLLDGKKATTHWKWAGELAQKSPNATVDPDPIFIRDGKMFTTAGVTAGMDLALALVEEDLGASLALRVARELVLYLRRPGGQSQFSAAISLQSSDRKPIADLQAWVLENLDSDLSVDSLARHCHMSPRHFARVFRSGTGLTPYKFVERARIEAARRRLEESEDALETIAANCGFGSADSLRRSFLRMLHISPGDYRSRFSRNRRSAIA
jgi:transcriptional regulator GlxA family with amidase domain